MSTYEKIASAVVGVLLILMVIFSYHEFKEPTQHPALPGAPSDFDDSIGQNFIIGPYASVVSEQSSATTEDNCSSLQSVIVAALHDIKEHLEHVRQGGGPGAEDPFQVNQKALELFCHTTAVATLSDGAGNELVLEKIPFTRAIPPGGGPSDMGTEVRINATLIPAGTATSTPAQMTTYGDELIPDRYLDSGTTQ